MTSSNERGLPTDQRLLTLQRLERHRPDLQADPEQTVERHGVVTSPIPTEGELVEVRLQVLPPEPVIDAESVPLEVGKDPMNPGHYHMRVDPGHHRGGVLTLGKTGVGLVAVRPNLGTGNGNRGHELVQGHAGVVGDRCQPDATGDLSVVQFDRSGDRHFADRTPSLTTGNGFVLGPERNDRLVDFDNSLKGITVGIDHGLAQLVQEQPSGLVRTDTELRLQLQGGNAVGMGGEQVRCKEPRPERQVRPVHDRPGRHGRLLPARRAFPGPGLGFEPPALGTTAGTAKALGPTLLGEVIGASAVVMERVHERLQRGRAIVLPTAGHERNLTHNRPHLESNH